MQLSYHMRIDADRDTLPPTSAPDRLAADFEREVRERGESLARWDRLMALLAEQEEANHDAAHVATRDVCRRSGARS
jgi:hypothetical protein